MAETEAKVELKPENPAMEIEKVTTKEEEKPSRKEKKSKKEKRSKKHRSRSRSDSESTDESKSKSKDRKGSESKSPTKKSHRKKKEKRSKKHRKRSSSSRSSSSKSRERSRSRSHSSRRRRSRRDNSYESRRRRDDRNRDRDNRNRHYDRDRAQRNKGYHRENRHERERKNREDGSRSRTRSPHPLLKGSAAQEIPVKTYKIDEANKSKMFWDGFQWVAKNNAASSTADPAALNQTKKLRRLLVSNLPLNLGLGEKEVGDLVTKFILENFLHDEGDFQPVREVVVDSGRNSATIELSSVEEANRLAKVESVKILGHNCRVQRATESMFGKTTNFATLIADAQQTAQAQAAVIAAMSMLQKKDATTSFTLSKLNVLGNTSKILKVTNLVDSEIAKNIDNEQLVEIHDDIADEFGKAGKIMDSFIVKKEKTIAGAETGTIFLIFESEAAAEKGMNSMSNKRYEGREIRVIYVDEETFKKSFANLKE